MRTTKVLSVSLPPEMLSWAEEVARSEHRTMSELVREALRAYKTLRQSADKERAPKPLAGVRRAANEQHCRQGLPRCSARLSAAV